MPDKNKIREITITDIKYPNIGTGLSDGLTVEVKNTLPGQTVEASLTKKRGQYIGRKLRVITKAPSELEPLCPDFESCGGCTYQNISYVDELKLKEYMVKKLLSESGFGDISFLGVQSAEDTEGYRNKMEFSFGDECKGGSLALGMRKRGSFYEVVTSKNCRIIDSDYKKILMTVLEYFKNSNQNFYHRMTKLGALRHLIIRKARYTGEIIVNLVTTSNFSADLTELSELLKNLSLEGKITGFLHTENDSVADAINCDTLTPIFGKTNFTENLLGLSFDISPFSFFQTNSAGASALYSYAADLVKQIRPQTVFDLYCGTGTIAQLISKHAARVTGIEIIPEAITSAKLNAIRNNIHNCDFITGDVLTTLDNLNSQPDQIILDPPRDGLHPKAAKKIISLKPNTVIYISCKPTSLVRDLKLFAEAGYNIESVKCFDLFSRTYHVETCVLLSRKNS